MTARAKKRRKRDRRRARRRAARDPWATTWGIANEYDMHWGIRSRLFVVQPSPALVRRAGYGGRKGRSAARKLAGSCAVVTGAEYRALRAASPGLYHLVDPEGQHYEACVEYGEATRAERRTA